MYIKSHVLLQLYSPTPYMATIVNWRRGMCNMEWSMKMIESECVHKKNPKTPRFRQLNNV